MLTSQQRHILSQQAWFSAMPLPLQDVLLSAATLRLYQQGQAVHLKDDSASGFYGICRGRLRVAHHSPDGREMLLALLDPGNWFGEVAMFDDKARTHTVYCETKAELAVISRTRFQHLLNTHPDFYPYFMRLLCTRVRSAFQFIDASASMSLREQLLRRLQMLMTSYGQHFAGASPVTLTVSQEALAQMINSSRQTVNQILRTLQEEGKLTLGYRRITVHNPGDLLDGINGGPGAATTGY
ncbi:Crp/Fnr family transcriptional regulator [Alteromonas sp. CYL-A6]|uniref:Crp/Fnr family transcriptional regulator n=1 Tax=Alteromonas nitratireducens TaxID=3390813 RepID=UPI0034ADC0CF